MQPLKIIKDKQTALLGVARLRTPPLCSRTDLPPVDLRIAPCQAPHQPQQEEEEQETRARAAAASRHVAIAAPAADTNVARLPPVT